MSERDPRYLEDRREEAARLYRSGLSEREVAAQMGVSRARAHDYLDDAGVERRPVGAPVGNRNAARNGGD